MTVAAGSVNEHAAKLGIPKERVADTISVMANFAVVSANGDDSLAASYCLSACTAIIDSFVADYDPAEMANKIREVVLAFLIAHKADRPTLH